VVFQCRRADQWREDVVFEDKTIVGGASAHGDQGPDDIGQFEKLIQSYSDLSHSFDADIYKGFAGFSRFFRIVLKAQLCHGIPDIFFDWFLLR
jgi:hypothetical protein